MVVKRAALRPTSRARAVTRSSGAPQVPRTVARPASSPSMACSRGCRLRSRASAKAGSSTSMSRRPSRHRSPSNSLRPSSRATPRKPKRRAPRSEEAPLSCRRPCSHESEPSTSRWSTTPGLPRSRAPISACSDGSYSVPSRRAAALTCPDSMGGSRPSSCSGTFRRSTSRTSSEATNGASCTSACTAWRGAAKKPIRSIGARSSMVTVPELRGGCRRSRLPSSPCAAKLVTLLTVISRPS